VVDDRDAGPRSAADRRLAELREQGKRRSPSQTTTQPIGGAPLPKDELVELECQLTNLQGMADGNWAIRLVCPFRDSEAIQRCHRFYGWRLRMTLELHPSSWE
jgi:hypothetical protein